MLTISLFCCRLWRYSFVVGNSGNDVITDVPFNNSWEKDMKLSVPINERSGSTMSGVHCVCFRWWEFLSTITCSMISESSTVLNSKLGVFLCHSILLLHLLECRFFVRMIFYYLLLNNLFCSILLLPVQSFVC